MEYHEKEIFMNQKVFENSMELTLTPLEEKSHFKVRGHIGT